MSFELPALPFAMDALAPVMSAETMEYHHGKHHKAYVDNTNKLSAGTALEGKSLEDIVKGAAADTSLTGLFNNAAQHWNHSFFWNSLSPKGGKIPGELEAKIREDFGSVEKFKEDFANAGLTQFGSGWAWLVLEAGKLKIVKTANADLPLLRGQKPLLVCDVWEHAYYIDYRNRRADFLKAFVDGLANYEFAAANLAKTG